MKRLKKQEAGQNEISAIYTFSLGKIPQKVLIEGRRKDLPVVIALHGGPGTPVPFSVGGRGMFPEFTDRFLMVSWDQLGCGINDYKLNENFTISFFVDMTAELIREIKKLFPENQLILFGMSWGSVLALKVLEKAGTEVDAVVVWGQVLKKLFFNEEVYVALEQAGFSDNNMQRVRAITADNFTDKDMQFMAKSIRKHTDGYTNRKGKRIPLFPIIRGLLMSKDYNLKDFKAVMVNGTVSATWLWKELLKIDLTKCLRGVEVPYYILQGDTDIVTSTAEVKRQAECSGNPNLHCQVIAHSGHMPGMEGMEAVLETLVSAAGGQKEQPRAKKDC